MGALMLEIGSIIKMQRNKQKMTLSDLAEGLISISYLSKIENLKTEPSSHIIEKLCKRLGIEVNHAMDDVIEVKLKKWFKMLLNKHDKNEVNKRYEELDELLNANLSDSILLFELYKIRYYLYISDKHAAINQMKRMAKICHSFEVRELYFWHKFRGDYYSKVGETNEALVKYETAEKHARKFDVTDEELADLNYSLSVTYSQRRQILESISYANHALDIFMKRYQFIRCAECHIVLGICYRRIKMYDKAIDNYNLAKHLAGLSKRPELIQLINHNLGYLYATLGKHAKAIKFYLEIVEDSEVSIEGKIIALTDLVKVHYEIGEMNQANEKIEQAFTLLKNYPKQATYTYYRYVLFTYYYLINDQTTKFVAIIKNKLIPYLKKKKDYAKLTTFTTMLAKHYEASHKYKEATEYYKLANHSYNELSII